MFTGWDRPSHWLVLAVIVVVLFGYKKLPDAARSVGRSLRIFKTEIKGMTEDDKAREQARTETDAAAPEPARAVVVQKAVTAGDPPVQSSADSAEPDAQARRPRPNAG